MLFGRRPIPVSDRHQQPDVAPKRLHARVVIVVQDAVAAHGFSRLTNEQAQIGKLDGDGFERDERTSDRRVFCDVGRRDIDPRYRHSALHASIELEYFQLEIDRFAEFRVRHAERLKLHALAGFRPRAALGSGSVNHVAIIHVGGNVGAGMRVLMVASEVTPYSKTGGLADVAGALPRALARLGHEVDVVVPAYRGTPVEGPPSGSLRIPVGSEVYDAGVSEVLVSGVRIVLLHHDAFFDRPSLYGEAGEDYPDNAERFAFLSRGALEWAAAQGERYDVVHTHDWQTGLVPVLLRHVFSSNQGLGQATTVHTIHNLAFQGTFDASWLPRLGLGWGMFRPDALEYWGRVSFLKGGIMFSRRITTVSRRYAAEIQTPEFGCGFEGILKNRAADLVGILNGIDYDEWDPKRDPHLAERFDASTIELKRANKRQLLREFGFPSDQGLERPLVGLVSRLVDQKGFDLIAGLVDHLPTLPATFVLLGTGDRRYEEMWTRLAARYPRQVGVRIGFDEGLAHRIEGGADLFLMPSRFEPCGLNQMYSSRYGTLPLVRTVGGLADTVENLDLRTGGGTGFTFDAYTPEALLGTLRWALDTYRNRSLWRRMQVAGMAKDFSWDASAREYVKVYEGAAG